MLQVPTGKPTSTIDEDIFSIEDDLHGCFFLLTCFLGPYFILNGWWLGARKCYAE